MFTKKTLLVAAFGLAVTFGGLGLGSEAKADVCFRGGGFGGPSFGAYGPSYGYRYPSRSVSYRRGFDRRYDYGFGGPSYRGFSRRGVSFSLGF